MPVTTTTSGRAGRAGRRPRPGRRRSSPCTRPAPAADDKQLAKAMARYGRVDPLCIVELGYGVLDRRGAELLFGVLTEREEKNSVAINESFGGWTRTFTDPRRCAAIVDRLCSGI
jgi:DNA replication protein DnaC